MTTETPPILGLVLAGGLARRMGGGDKARIRIGGKTILERVLGRLAPQCTNIILNANGDPARFSTPACRWCPTRCRISPVRSPAFLPGSTGRRRTHPK
jgi:molybdopterin-guanine dinucleotide biosynthesis protein A